MRALIVLGMVAGLVAGCDTLGNPLEAIGGKVPAPDEFQVIARKPLIMPGSRALPEPRPGAASPLDPTPNRDAQVALLGSETRAVGPAGGSAAEQVLLQSANVSAANPEVRVQLETDKTEVDDNAPYEPPTIAELFFGTDADAPDPGTVLDPVAESQRLQRAGQAAPNDPEAQPVDPQARGPIVVGGEPLSSESPPRRTLPGATPVPAF